MTPLRASARARAASKSRMPCTLARSEKSSSMASQRNSGSSRLMQAVLSLSKVEENRFFGALHNHIPFEGALPIHGLFRNQCAAARRLHQVQHEIGGVTRLVGEVDACDEAPQQAPHEHRHCDVRSLHFSIRSRDLPGPDRGEAEAAVAIGRN